MISVEGAALGWTVAAGAIAVAVGLAVKLGTLIGELKKEREITAALRAEVAKLKQHHHQAETEQAVRMARPLKYPRQHSA